MMDFQGTLKAMILPPGTKPTPWQQAVKIPEKAAKPLKKVRPRHRMVVSMHLAGYQDTEIADALGYTPVRVNIIRNSQHPELLQLREELGNKVANSLGDMVLRFHAEANKSVDTIVAIRDDPKAPSSERRLSALALLDRAGYSPVKKQMNFDAKTPIADLQRVAGEIEKANEVFVRRQEWEVKNLPTGTDG